ncbi:hypothetical protein [Curtobacterium sp. MCJR17_043]|uniref:hypothetical protein n=1 Tax=Curtobacterium sp. MCJR17_043 TaxID=2175660 RepID=UPI0024DFB52A|nr:hypothetical protein [Curtobacterium sp. MCJR17_043]WIB36300.1 hypothetical protein DEJ15_03780 [Curtobacterium sp. MCJR17_043]
MSHSVDDAAQRARYWPVPVLRAVPAAVIAMVITFSPNHSAGFGLVLFGVFALVDGAVLAWGEHLAAAWGRPLAAIRDGAGRPVHRRRPRGDRVQRSRSPPR